MGLSVCAGLDERSVESWYALQGAAAGSTATVFFNMTLVGTARS